MNKIRSLWLGILVLGALNICCLVFILTHGPGGPPEHQFDQLIIDSLELTEAQVKQFDELKREHHRQMMDLDAAMQQPYEQYFGLLTGDRDPRKEDSLGQVLGEIYGQKVNLTYQHFADVKALCTPEQQAHFKKVVPFLMQVISPHKPMGPPGPKP